MKEEIKKLLRESITVYEAKEEESDKEVKDSEEDKKDSDKEERDKEEGHKEKYVSKGEQDELEDMADVVYDMRLGGQLSRCVRGKDGKRTKQSAIRKYMLDDPYDDMGPTPKSLAEKIISCMTKLRKKISKV